MRHGSIWRAALAWFLIVSGASQQLHAQSGAEAELLAEVQGRWVSRFPGKDHSIEIRGNEVRVVKADPSLNDGAVPGTVVAIIGVVDEKRTEKSLVDGRTIYNYRFTARRWTTDGRRYFLVDRFGGFNGLTMGTTFCQDTPSSFSKPYSEYRTLSGLWGGDMFRPETKDRAFPPNDPRSNWRDPVVPKCSAPASRTTRPSASAPARPVTAIGSSRSGSGSTISSQPVEPASVPVTTAQELAEIATRERLNREQADFAARQLAENRAAKAAFDKATAEREATIARQQAETQRNAAEYAAAMAKWRADVEACQQGDFSRCAPQ